MNDGARSSGRAGMVLLAGVLGLTVVSGCTTAEPAGQADYPAYASSAELIAKADLVVHGVALSSRAGKLLPDPATGTDPQAKPQAGLPTTDRRDDEAAVEVTITTVRVDEVFKGPGAPGDLIEVSQLGSAESGVRYEGTTMLSSTAKSGYVLFLASYGPGKSHDLLNPDALYTVADGGALTPVGPGTPPLATIDELRSAVPSPR